MAERKKACKVEFDGLPGIVFFTAEVGGQDYLFGNFKGQFALVKADKVKAIEGNLRDLDKEKW